MANNKTIVVSVAIELAKEMVIIKGINPSERVLSKAIDVPRYEAGQLLVRMEVDGVLVRDGRYRRLNPKYTS